MESLPTEPIAGIHPLLWLIILLVLGPPAILSKTAADKFGLLGALARHVRNRQVRTLEREQGRAVAEQAVKDIAYAALQVELHRLAKLMQDQGARHDKQIQELREEQAKEHKRMESIIHQLREEMGIWEDYGAWVSAWASRQTAKMIREGVTPAPPPFLSFHEYKADRQT